jgi:hypothetical protein
MREDRLDRTGEQKSTQIQGAYDYCGGESAYIIADVTTDDAWMAIESGKAASIEAYR